MRILMSTDTVGGVWIYALELARELIAEGNQVVLATMGAPLSADQRRAVDALAGLEVRESRFRLEWMQDPWDDVERAGRWLLDLEAETRPDVVHLNHYAHTALPWGSPRVSVAHSDVLSWFAAVKGHPAGREWDRYAGIVRAGLEAAEVRVAPTQAVADDLRRSYGLRGEVRVIPNGRATEKLRPALKQELILAVGRLWDEAKNIAALEAVAGDLPWPVRVAGSARSPDGAERRLRGVECLGELAPDVLAQHFGRAAIYALPARYEPFGLSVLEAGAAGCALVLGDIPSLRENWDGAAMFVPPDDEAELRAALLRLISDPGSRDELARKSQARAQRFAPRRMAQAYLELYRGAGGS